MSSVNNIPPVIERMEKIVEKIMRNNPDIVCLQEAFDRKSTDELASRFKSKGYNVMYNVGKGFPTLNSGLFIATKYEIQDPEFREFSRGIGSDACASKGVAKVQIKHPTMGEINVYNTHMQSDAHKPEAAEVNMQQMDEIKTFLKKPDENIPSILVGDFNMGKTGENKEKMNIWSDERNLLKQGPLLNRAPKEDICTVYTPNTEDGKDFENLGTCMFDHILTSATLDGTTTVFKKESGDNESDHEMVSIELEKTND